MRTFEPWVGKRYDNGGIRGVRLLILGESFYNSTGRDPRTFTSEMIRQLGQQGRFRFYTTTQRLVVGGSGWLSDAERSAFWEQVAFYNYIQSFAPRPRWRPTPEMWTAARAPFLATLAELRPDVLLILGRQLRQNLPVLPPELRVCEVPHPSSGRLRYASWQPVVRAALEGNSP